MVNRSKYCVCGFDKINFGASIYLEYLDFHNVVLSTSDEGFDSEITV